MFLGGFGLFTDLWQSTAYGDFGGAIFGPTFGTVEDIATAALTFDGSDLGRTMVRLPIFQAAHAFYRAVHHTPEIINNYVNLTGEAGMASSGQNYITPRGQLAYQDAQSKRGE